MIQCVRAVTCKSGLMNETKYKRRLQLSRLVGESVAEKKTNGPREYIRPDWSKKSPTALCVCSIEQCTRELFFHKTPYGLSFYDFK
jgi:hypothetical protein